MLYSAFCAYLPEPTMYLGPSVFCILCTVHGLYSVPTVAPLLDSVTPFRARFLSVSSQKECKPRW